MSIKAKRSDLQEIVIISDNNPDANAKLIIRMGTPREIHPACSGDYYNTPCVRFVAKGDWDSDSLHITKESARKLIPLLQEFIEDDPNDHLEV